MTRLIADIGGTNARFALVEPGRRGARRALPAGARLTRTSPPRPRPISAADRVTEAVIAVATPVETDEIGFTNSPWRFSISGLQGPAGPAATWP